MTTIWVTNKGTEGFSDYYHGFLYNFEPGIPVALPEAAAQHIFGYGVDNKTPHLIRLGWLKYSNELDAALQKLNSFMFSTAKPETNHEPPSVVDEVAPLPVRGRGVKRLHAA